MEELFMQDTDYSVRDQNGMITFFDTADQAVANFIGYEGYRLSIKVEGATVYFYRDELPIIPNCKPGSLADANPSARNEYEAKIIVTRS